MSLSLNKAAGIKDGDRIITSIDIGEGESWSVLPDLEVNFDRIAGDDLFSEDNFVILEGIMDLLSPPSEEYYRNEYDDEWEAEYEIALNNYNDRISEAVSQVDNKSFSHGFSAMQGMYPVGFPIHREPNTEYSLKLRISGIDEIYQSINYTQLSSEHNSFGLGTPHRLATILNEGQTYLNLKVTTGSNGWVILWFGYNASYFGSGFAGMMTPTDNVKRIDFVANNATDYMVMPLSYYIRPGMKIGDALRFGFPEVVRPGFEIDYWYSDQYRYGLTRESMNDIYSINENVTLYPVWKESKRTGHALVFSTGKYTPQFPGSFNSRFISGQRIFYIQKGQQYKEVMTNTPMWYSTSMSSSPVQHTWYNMEYNYTLSLEDTMMLEKDVMLEPTFSMIWTEDTYHTSIEVL